MSALSDTVSELCATFGLPARGLSADGHMALSIGALGQAHFEELDGELLVYLVRDIDVGMDRLRVLRQALNAVHFHNTPPFPVQAALYGEALVFVTRFQDHGVTVQELEQALEMLGDLQDEAQA